MQKIILLLCAIVLYGTACKKNKNGIDAELDKLPPITQTGANTFGCLVDGVAFIPNGRAPNGSSNTYAYIDPNFQGGRVSIEGIKYNSSPFREYVSVGAFNCKNVGTYNFNDTNNLNRIVYQKNSTNGSNPCQYACYIGEYRRGNMSITKYDLNTRICSGTFEAVIYLNSQTCKDTVRITQGRFDVRF